MENLFTTRPAKSLVEQICEVLMNGIIEGKLKPGEMLTELVLQKEFGVSRTPIREALRILEEKGLVQIIPRKSAYVKKVTWRDVEELFPVRAMLEGHAARLATVKLTEEDLQGMADSIEGMEKSASTNDFLPFLQNHYNFHRIYIRASDNDLIRNILEDLLRKAVWFRYSFLYFHTNYPYSLKMHKDILGLFKARDPIRAEALVKEHIEVGKDQFLTFLRSDKNKAIRVLRAVENKEENGKEKPSHRPSGL